MPKGASQQAQTNTGIGRSYSEGYQGQGSDIASSELPFLKNELTNPQGFGQQDLSQMQTQSGQAVSGALGAGKEQALLNASRTGNTAAVPGVIDATTRDAMKQQSTNALDTNLANAKLKQDQQQAGASGLEKMYGTDVSAAMSALGLSNQAINDWTQADTATTNGELGWVKAAETGASTGAGIAG